MTKLPGTRFARPGVEAGPMPRGLRRVCCLAGAVLIVAATFWAHAPAIRAGYIWDDDVAVLNNTIVHDDAGLYRIWFTGDLFDYFPLTYSAFWLQWRLWGREPMGYHVVNIALHALAALALWAVMAEWWGQGTRAKGQAEGMTNSAERTGLNPPFRLGFWPSTPGPILIALAFAVHPVTVASVAWVTELKNTLSMVFAALALWAYLRFDRLRRGEGGGWGWYALALLAFALALLSKTSVVMLPVLVLLLTWWRWDKDRAGAPRWSQAVLYTAPMFTMSAVMGAVTIYFQKTGAIQGAVVTTATWPARVAIAGRAVWFYIGSSFWPANRMMVYPRWDISGARVADYLPVLLLVAVAAAAAGLAWRQPSSWRGAAGRLMLLVLACFTVLLLPILGFVDMFYMVYAPVADQWQYVTVIIGPAVVVGVGGWACARWRVLTGPALVLALAAVVILGVQTRRYSGAFANAETLWRDNIAKNPRAAVAWNNLGLILAERGEVAQGIACYERALAARPNYGDAYTNYGRALESRGQWQAALEKHREALRRDPRHIIAMNNLAVALVRQGSPGEAVYYLEKAIETRPDYVDARSNLANVLGAQGRFDAALEHFRIALSYDPNAVTVIYNFGNTLLSARRPAEAEQRFRETLALDRGHYPATFGLAEALAAQGRDREAITTYSAAMAMSPQDPRPRAALAQVLARNHQFADAIAQARAALDRAQAQNNPALAQTLRERITAYERAAAIKSSGSPSAQPTRP